MIRSSLSFFCAIVLLGACSSSSASDDAASDTTTVVEEETTGAPAAEAAGDGELGVSVNGVELTVAEFDEHIESWSRIAEGQGQTVRDDDGLTNDFIAGITEQYLRFESFMDAIADDGIEITDDDRAVAEETALTSIGDPSDEPARAQAVEWLAGLVAMEPTEEELDAYIADNTDQLRAEAICSSHILVDTAEVADDVVTRLEAGEAFEDLATELSTDPGSGALGGDLGCVGLGAFVPEFEEAALAAEPGVVTDPVESQFGFHLIVTREPTVEDLRPLAASQFEEATGLLLNDALESATVELAPQFGSWDATTKTYLPPA